MSINFLPLRSSGSRPIQRPVSHLVLYRGHWIIVGDDPLDGPKSHEMRFPFFFGRPKCIADGLGIALAVEDRVSVRNMWRRTGKLNRTGKRKRRVLNFSYQNFFTSLFFVFEYSLNF